MNYREQFLRDGYLIIDTDLPESLIDRLLDNIQPFWDKKVPLGSGYHDSNRLQDVWNSVPEVMSVATHKNILCVLRNLYGKTPLPFQTLNFKQGSEQRIHGDNIHFNSEPFGMMCGVWVALEDISLAQGPLIYYPKSHCLDEINFEEAGLVADYENYTLYEDYIEALINENNFIPEYGLIKKGQAIIWSANILHGGSPQTDRTLTRYSQVTHYYFPGCRYWRPGCSKEGRAYFDPWWIPYKNAMFHIYKSRIRYHRKQFIQRIKQRYI